MAEHIKDASFLADIAQIKESNQKKESSESGTTTETATEEKKEGAEEKKPEQSSISQAELIAQLKASGIDVSSLDELKTKITPKQEARKKSDEEVFTEALQFGVQNGKIKLDDYDKAVKYKSIGDKEIVKEKFVEKLREKNPRMSDEEAEAKFNKRFSAEEKIEEIKGNVLDPDEVTDRKITYILDEDELKDEADKIRKGYWNPIEKVKEEYSSFTKQQEDQKGFFESVENVKKEIPSKVSWNLGDEKNPNMVEFIIPDELKPLIEKTVIGMYANYKDSVANGFIKEDKPYDVNQAAGIAAQSIAFNNILRIYGDQRENEGMLKGAEPFKNSTKEPLEMNTKEKNGKQPTESVDEIAARYERHVRGY